MSYVVVLSGPEAARQRVEVALESARIPILPLNHPALMDWRSKFPSMPEDAGFVSVAHPDVNAPHAVVEPLGWRLLVHYEMPAAPMPDPMVQVVSTMAEMQSELASLRALVRGGR